MSDTILSAIPQPWWGATTLLPGQSGQWRVGALSFWLRRQPGEIEVTTDASGDRQADGLERHLPPRDPPPPGAIPRRFSLPDGADTVLFEPVLADRPVVARPERPFVLPPETTARFFVSTHLFVRLTAGVLLGEWPAYRGSDTWFGPSLMVGELCYAGWTTLRPEVTDLPRLPNRAVTAVTVDNRSTAPLAIQRIRLPMRELSLYLDYAGLLWTNSLTYTRKEADESAAVQLGSLPPDEAMDPVRLQPPRDPSRGLTVARVFNSLLS
jgi:hypothetical protein